MRVHWLCRKSLGFLLAFTGVWGVTGSAALGSMPDEDAKAQTGGKMHDNKASREEPESAPEGKPKSERVGRPGQRGRDDGAPKLGDEAPDFKLKMLKDDAKEVHLAQFRGKKPMVLFFGSYT